MVGSFSRNLNDRNMNKAASEPYFSHASVVDLSRFDAAPLIAFSATKEMNYGTETDR